MIKKTEQPDHEPQTADASEPMSTARPDNAAPSPLDQWVGAWAKTQTLPTLVERLKHELQARDLDDPALVEAHHLGAINAAIRAALQLDGHALMAAAEKVRGVK